MIFIYKSFIVSQFVEIKFDKFEILIIKMIMIPFGGLFVGGFTKTCTSAVEDCSESSVTLSTNVYIPSSKFDNCK